MNASVLVLWALANRWRGRADGSPPLPLCGRCKTQEGAGWIEHVWMCLECLDDVVQQLGLVA